MIRTKPRPSVTDYSLELDIDLLKEVGASGLIMLLYLSMENTSKCNFFELKCPFLNTTDNNQAKKKLAERGYLKMVNSSNGNSIQCVLDNEKLKNKLDNFQSTSSNALLPIRTSAMSQTPDTTTPMTLSSEHTPLPLKNRMNRLVPPTFPPIRIHPPNLYKKNINTKFFSMYTKVYIKKINSINPKRKCPSPLFDEVLNISDNFHKKDNEDNKWNELVNQWLEYKISRRESYKTSKSIEMFTNHLKKLSNNNLIHAKEIIDNSMACNYAGIFPIKHNVGGETPKTYNKIGKISKNKPKKCDGFI